MASWTSEEEDLKGNVVHGYVILGELGRGASSVVYQAVDTRKGSRRVAFKVMSTTEQRLHDRTSGSEHPFARELRLSRVVDDPVMVRIYEAGTLENGRYFMVMEYVEGETLEQTMATTGCYSWQDALSLWNEVVFAVGSFHRMNIVHRDISPGNVLLKVGRHVKSRVKLIDYGLACYLNEIDCDIDGSGLGTPLYMAPELAQQKPGSMRSDVYSLGAVFYEMVCGQPVLALERLTPHTCLEYLRSEQPIPSQAMKKLVADDIPAGLRNVVLSCLHRDPEKRPENAQTLYEMTSRYIVRDNERTPSKTIGWIGRIVSGIFRR
jgi:serine/threonine protein kinase